jgi:UDP-N-acetylmuramoyl-tripeptide--D-alanyl-D-alanine ligase
MNLVALAGGVLLVDDHYNANPQSMEAALRGLAELASEGRAFAALGDMGELGDTADAAHEAAGRLAAELGLHALAALGERAERVVAGARAAGLPPEAAFVARDADECIERLLAGLRPGDCVLVKGSRAARMERVARGLVERLGTA